MALVALTCHVKHRSPLRVVTPQVTLPAVCMHSPCLGMIGLSHDMWLACPGSSAAGTCMSRASARPAAGRPCCQSTPFPHASSSRGPSRLALLAKHRTRDWLHNSRAPHCELRSVQARRGWLTRRCCGVLATAAVHLAPHTGLAALPCSGAAARRATLRAAARAQHPKRTAPLADQVPRHMQRCANAL